MPKSPRSAIHALIADAQPASRSALRLLLEQEHSGASAGEVASEARLVEAVQQSNPDLIIVDWDLAGRCLWQHLNQLPRRNRPCVIILSSRSESRQAAIRAGADRFVWKGDSPDALRSALRQCAARPSGD